AVGYLVFAGKAADKSADVLDRLRDAPAQVTLIALVLTVLLVIATKAWTGRGTPLRGGLPSGHAAIAFAAWVAAAYIVGDTHRFVVSALTFIMALLVAQTRVESGIHSTLEVISGAAIGSLVTLSVFQFVQRARSCTSGPWRSRSAPTRRIRTTWSGPPSGRRTGRSSRGSTPRSPRTR